MSLLAAERSFNDGLAALAQSRNRQASKHFRDAMQIEETRNASRPDMRYLSYYGLSVARAGGNSAVGLRSCRTAADQEPHKPVFLLNLGLAHLECGESDRAFDCFRRGASLAPAHGPLRRELARLTRQIRPALKERGKVHLAHRWVNQIRSGWRRRVPRWLALSRGCPTL
jgi:tetratricopeptide (TPR) repeat protein